MSISENGASIRNTSYEVRATAAVGAITIVILIQVVQTSPDGVGAILWVIGLVCLLALARALFSARLVVRDKEVRVSNLFWTSRYPVEAVRGLSVETGQVNLSQRAYLRLEFEDGKGKRLTQFNRAVSETDLLEQQAAAINRALDQAGSNVA